MSKTILITGANRGLGLGLTRSYQAAQWQVIATCRNPNQARDLLNLGLEPLTLDVTSAKSILELKGRLKDQAIDILFCNAGIFGPRNIGIGSLDEASWLEVLKVNTIAPTLIAQAFEANVAASQDKLMVFMSSNLSSIAKSTGGEYMYRSSKAALNMIVASLAKDLASKGIRTVSISPGWVRTDMGGSEALLSVEESVRGIKSALDNLDSKSSGVFLNYDGTPIAW